MGEARGVRILLSSLSNFTMEFLKSYPSILLYNLMAHVLAPWAGSLTIAWKIIQLRVHTNMINLVSQM
jgi:hypothetical protein